MRVWIVSAIIVLSLFNTVAAISDAPDLSHSCGDMGLGEIIDPMPGTHFTPNMGQISDPDVIFHSQNVYFTSSGIIFRVTAPFDGDKAVTPYSSPTPASIIYNMNFVGSNNVDPIGVEQLGHSSNFFLGDDPAKWATDVPNYKEIRYEGLYDGIDLVWKMVPNGLKYEYEVDPDVDPGVISVEYEGADVCTDGTNLFIVTPVGTILDGGLYVYETDDPALQVKARITISDNVLGYDLENDPEGSVVIDPLIYSTYIGAAGSEGGNAVAVDGNGNAFVTGHTSSPNFPTTIDAYNREFAGDTDVFVLSLNSDGTELLYSTFIGGTSFEYGFSIALDGSSNAYVTGTTMSGNFPTTMEAYNGTLSGGYDAFVLKLDSTGTDMFYSTFIGGFGHDEGRSIAVDQFNNAYITGSTGSEDFPTTLEVHNMTYNGGESDVFVSKINGPGTELVFSTFVGGNGVDHGTDLSLDPSNNVYITGTTLSNNYPTTPAAFKKDLVDGANVFVTKLDPTAVELSYSTYIGGGVIESLPSMVLDTSNNVYITGSTNSVHFPTTAGAYSTTLNGETDVFVTKLGPTGADLWFSTYLGGQGHEDGTSIDLDGSGKVIVTGRTISSDFPTTPDAHGRYQIGGYDAFLARFDTTGRDLEYSTYLGGDGPDLPTSVALDGTDHVYITGRTESGDLPVTDKAYDTDFGGVSDVFVLKMYFPTLPGLPLNITADAGDGHILLSWSPPMDDGGKPIEHYSIYRSTDGDQYTGPQMVDGETIFNDTDVINGLTYHYILTAVNPVGEGPETSVITATPGAPPTEPLNLTFTQGYGHVHLDWDIPSDEKGFPVLNYRLYKGMENGDVTDVAVNPEFTEYNDTEVQNGVTYDYSISAVNQLGEGPRSNTVRATPGTVASQPINLSAEGLDRSVFLTWEPPEDNGGFHITGYLIYRGLHPDSLDLLGDINSTDHFEDANVENGKVYYYAVKAITSRGEGQMSFIEPAYPGRVPSAPELSATAGDRHVKLEWSTPDNGGWEVQFYRVYKGHAPDPLSPFAETTKNSFNDTEVTNDHEYNYSVMAVNLKGDGTPSQTISAIPYRTTNNNPVILNIPPLYALIDTTYSHKVQALDPDGDPLTYVLLTKPTGMTIRNDGTIGWTPDTAGDYPALVMVTDDRGASAKQWWVIHAINEPVLTVTIESPKDGTEADSRIRVGGMATISHGRLEAVEVMVDGSEWMVAEGTLAWYIDIDLTDLDQGQHTVIARSTDGTHYSTESSLKVIVPSEPLVTDDGQRKVAEKDQVCGLSPVWLMVLLIILIVTISSIIYVKTRKPEIPPPMPGGKKKRFRLKKRSKTKGGGAK